MRSLAAYRFDRNCVLAATAGQVLAALNLDCPIRAIVFASSPLDVGIVARSIKLVDPDANAKTALIASAGAVALHKAVGLGIDELLDPDGWTVVNSTMMAANLMVEIWVMDGRLAALVKTLDRWSIPGDMTELEWLNVLKDDRYAERLEQAEGRSG